MDLLEKEREELKDTRDEYRRETDKLEKKQVSYNTTKPLFAYIGYQSVRKLVRNFSQNDNKLKQRNQNKKMNY